MITSTSGYEKTGLRFREEGCEKKVARLQDPLPIQTSTNCLTSNEKAGAEGAIQPQSIMLNRKKNKTLPPG